MVVDDGETSEATILSVRAKIYYLDKTSKAWKERGAGNLKINVPLQCVDIDEDTGAAVPGSFDASSLEDGDAKLVRLVMRQDSTHRVILNTAVFPAMEFGEKQGLKSVAISFTALEGNNEPVSIQLKVSLAGIPEPGYVVSDSRFSSTPSTPNHSSMRFQKCNANCNLCSTTIGRLEVFNSHLRQSTSSATMLQSAQRGSWEQTMGP